MTITAELQRDGRSRKEHADRSTPAGESWTRWLALPVVLAGTFVVTLDFPAPAATLRNRAPTPTDGSTSSVPG